MDVEMGMKLLLVFKIVVTRGQTYYDGHAIETAAVKRIECECQVKLVPSIYRLCVDFFDILKEG
jgi:hypothetical protein